MERTNSGKFTRKPQAGSDEMTEAHLQTTNGQRMALGKEPLPLPVAITERYEKKAIAAMPKREAK